MIKQLRKHKRNKHERIIKDVKIYLCQSDPNKFYINYWMVILICKVNLEKKKKIKNLVF